MNSRLSLLSPIFAFTAMHLLISACCAQETTNYQKALAEIVNTAERICQSAPLEQTSEGISLTGDAKAKLGGVVGKVAELGVSGSGKYESAKSFGVLQKDLIKAIQIGNNCKLEVFRMLQKDLIQNRQPPTSPAKKSLNTDKVENFVHMGADNWMSFPDDVQRARYDCLQKLFVYGTHPENFKADESSPGDWKNFIGYLQMRLTRDPSSLDIKSIDLRITIQISDKNSAPDHSRWYKYTCYFRNSVIVSSGFF